MIRYPVLWLVIVAYPLKKLFLISNLICVAQFTSEDVDQKDPVDLDFAKTFDLLHHTVSLKKVSIIGMTESLLTSINSFLSNDFRFV